MRFKFHKTKLPCFQPPRPNHDQGYVLFEALVSVIILSVGLVAGVGMLKKSIQLVQLRKHYLTPARELAESILVELELGEYGRPPQQILAAPDAKNPFHYQVVTSDWQGAGGLKQVQVIVSWSHRGKPGSFSLTTLLPATNGLEKRLASLQRRVAFNAVTLAQRASHPE
ncbi:MAG: hypothetical protein ACE5HO_04170 [bacterium]